MLSYLIYVSTATKGMSYDELTDLGSVSAINNAAFGITGVLLYDNGLFLQILEGEDKSIQTLFHNIEKDVRNTTVTLITQDELHHRNFPHWSMRVKDISQVEDDAHLRELSQQVREMNSSKTGAEHLGIVFHVLCTVLNNEYQPLLISRDKEVSELLKSFRAISLREKEILKYAVEGYTAKKISKILNISDKTVARHTENVCKKTHSLTKSDLIVKVFKSGYFKELIP